MIRRLWLVGCGNMAGAMLRRWLATGTLRPEDILVVNRSDRPLPEGVAQMRAFPEGALPDAVMLGMKPQQIDEVVAAHGRRIAGVPVLISILAGVEEEVLARRFPARSVVRAMPNLPVEIGKGVVALNSSSNDEPDRAAIAALMAPLGLVEWIPADRFDLVTALAGSGPGFLYRYIDAVAAAGAALGLSADLAARLAAATVEGAAILAAAADLPPAALADKVASPGGSTRKGLDVLDRDEALVRLLTDTLAASAARNAEMAAAAR